MTGLGLTKDQVDALDEVAPGWQSMQVDEFRAVLAGWFDQQLDFINELDRLKEKRS